MAYKDLKGDCYHHGMCCSEEMARDCERDYNTGRPYRESSKIQWDVETILIVALTTVIGVTLIGGSILYEYKQGQSDTQSEATVTQTVLSDTEDTVSDD